MHDTTIPVRGAPTLLRVSGVLVAIIVTATGLLAWTFGGAMVAAGDVARTLPEATEQLDTTTEATLRVIGAVRIALTDLDDVANQVATGADRAATGLEGVAAMTTNELPESIEAIQAALPGLIEAGAVIDRSMRSLALFGVEYSPEIPFDEALRDLESTLDGVPAELRAQGRRLEGLAPTIGSIGSATEELSGSLTQIDLALSQAATSLEGWRQSTETLASAGAPFETMSAIAGPLWRGLIVLAVVAGWGLAWVLWLASRRLASYPTPGYPALPARADSLASRGAAMADRKI